MILKILKALLVLLCFAVGVVVLCVAVFGLGALAGHGMVLLGAPSNTTPAAMGFLALLLAGQFIERRYA